MFYLNERSEDIKMRASYARFCVVDNNNKADTTVSHDINIY